MTNFKADIFIPTAGNIGSLKNCLESLTKQTEKNFKIIIVGKVREEKVLIKKFKDLKLSIVKYDKSIVESANKALSLSDSPIFIRIDDDIEADKNWLKNILQTFNEYRIAGGVTGPTLVEKNSFKARDLLNILDKLSSSRNSIIKLFYFLYNALIYDERIQDTAYIAKSGAFSIGSNYLKSTNLKKCIKVANLEACNFAVKTEVLKKIGGFDETFSRGLGDYHEADIACRIRREGYDIIYSPKAVVKHRIKPSGKKTRKDSYNRAKNFVIFYKRNIKVDSFEKFTKFSANLLIQNFYYIYKFIISGDFSQLGGLPGTFFGFFS